jgi:hypothetical protein
MTDNALRKLLALKTETRNLDYKETFDWSNATNDQKCEIVKDILAMLNTLDGGRIIIGVADSDHALVGVDQHAFDSFDTTRVNDFLRKYTDPVSSCTVYKHQIDSFRVVTIDIAEFKEIPVMCKASANSSATSKTILKQGGLYIRTDKATSELVGTSEEMRELLGRALLKKGDQLLHSIETLIKGRPTDELGSARQVYEAEIHDALEFGTKQLNPIGNIRGFWTLCAFPTDYNPKRISDFSTVAKFVSESEVSLRGWNFPHTDRDTASNFLKGRQSYTELTFTYKSAEAYRAYQSGLFFWMGRLFEDTYGDWADKRVLSYSDLIYRITEMFLFMKRYYERVAEDATLHIELTLSDTKNRILVSMFAKDGHLHGNYVCNEDHVGFEEDYAVTELRASDIALARLAIRRIYELFNWNNATENMIEGKQKLLLERKA